jgi:hypothetical protein
MSELWWRAVLALAMSIASNALADTIPIALGAPGTLSFDTTIPFQELNGTFLQGQNISLDFVFSGSEFARLFTVTTTYEASITLQTGISDNVGLLLGTGVLLDSSNPPIPIGTPQELGSASRSDGSINAVLFPLLSGDLSRPLDHFGVRFDLTFPTFPDAQVTGGEFRLLVDLGAGPFGIGPGLPADIVSIPENGSSILFLSGGLAALILATIGKSRARCVDQVTS